MAFAQFRAWGRLQVGMVLLALHTLAWLIIADCSQWFREGGGELYGLDMSPRLVNGKRIYCKPLSLRAYGADEGLLFL